MVEDLLYVLVGVDGRYITAQPLTGRQSRTFLVDPNLDLSVRELVNRILPVAASYSTVTRWAGLEVCCTSTSSLACSSALLLALQGSESPLGLLPVGTGSLRGEGLSVICFLVEEGLLRSENMGFAFSRMLDAFFP